MRQPLTQPAFHAARRHQHQFLGERVGQRVGQQGAEPVREQVGALGTVEVKRHRGATIDADIDILGSWGRPKMSGPASKLRRAATQPPHADRWEAVGSAK